MAKASNKKTQVFEYVEPIGARVVVRKDEPKRETKGGIALPDQAEIPTITGRIVTIEDAVELAAQPSPPCADRVACDVDVDHVELVFSARLATPQRGQRQSGAHGGESAADGDSGRDPWGWPVGND